MATPSEIHAPGWGAIDDALARLYPGQVPHQFASQTAYELDTPSPLPAVAVYEAPAQKIRGRHHPAHWHYIGYGLSELFDKSSADPEVSGFGFELTLRTGRADGEATPPGWGVRLLQALGRYVLTTGQGFDSGHRAGLGGPLIPGLPTSLTAIACVPDPSLAKIMTPFGSLLFLEVVGLQEAELSAMAAMDYEKVVMMLAEIDPFGLTTLERPSWLEDPRAAPIVRRYRLGIAIE